MWRQTGWARKEALMMALLHALWRQETRPLAEEEASFLVRLLGRAVLYPEWHNAVIAILWGLWVLNPWADAFANAPAFTITIRVAPEWMYGTVALGLGMSKAFALGSHRPFLRKQVALLLALFWFSISILVALSFPASVAVVVYFGYAGSCALAYLRLAGDK